MKDVYIEQMCFYIALMHFLKNPANWHNREQIKMLYFVILGIKSAILCVIFLKDELVWIQNILFCVFGIWEVSFSFSFQETFPN